MKIVVVECQHPDHYLWTPGIGASSKCPGCGSPLTLVQPNITISRPTLTHPKGTP